MTKSTFRALFAVGALTALAMGSGCVANRPSRTGVFDENQYLRKTFLTTDGSHPDTGWFVKGTITQMTTPNPLGGMGLSITTSGGGATGPGLVQFAITSDKLQMINMRQISSVPSTSTIPEVVNAWPVTNVDLKYRVNLDGEKSNFYEENQELDWQVRQWVKLNFDKNDMSDVAPLGDFITSSLEKCTDISNASTTLVPGSFQTYEGATYLDDYLQWTVQVSVPLNFNDVACTDSFAQSLGSTANFDRQNISFNLMYSLMRAKPVDDPMTNPNAFVPLVLDEKDPIHHKYGLLEMIAINRDASSELLAAQQMVIRHNPNQTVTYYFTDAVPGYFKDPFIGHRVYDSVDSQNADTTGNCLDATHCTRSADGILQQTNALMTQVGSKFAINFLNANDAQTFGDGLAPDRQFGDIRYHFINWIPEIDADTGWWGATYTDADPRTGQLLSETVNFNEAGPLQEQAYQLDYFLQELGASQGLGMANSNGTPQDWPTTPPGLSGTCKVGASVPLVTSVVQSTLNGNSSLFTKMQQYLDKPAATFGNLGPENFIVNQDADFLQAYYTLIPYAIFADPDTNPFVIREGGKGIYGPSAAFWEQQTQEVQFHQLGALIDKGLAPFEDVTGPNGLQNATAFVNQWRQLTQNHTDLQYTKQFIRRSPNTFDAFDSTSLTNITANAARHCISSVGGGTHWESKTEWVADFKQTFYEHLALHEFGHSLGLDHNFMGNVDKPNFPVRTDASGKPLKDANGNPVYSGFSNSVMEYEPEFAESFNALEWGPYDKAALGWIYTNNGAKPIPAGQKSKSITGQISATVPWNDKLGFSTDGKTETQYLMCQPQHVKYTPLCRTWDLGSTPSAIMANAIETYDWNWAFTNFRVYRKYWNSQFYANIPPNLMGDMRRFLMLWIYDWNSGKLSDTLRRIGFQPPAGVPAVSYYAQLENKFNKELSVTNQLVASFHQAVIQQSSGERPVATVYDQFYGDVTQQGIILDKLTAMQYWVGLWPGTNYDPNQAGAYFSSYSDAPDASYASIAQTAVNSMIGGGYDAFPYFVPSAVALFAQDTHSPAFGGAVQIRNWIGGKVFGGTEADPVQAFLNYFRDLAAQNNYVSPDGTVDCTHGFDACKYDPRKLTTANGAVDPSHNEFIGPDRTVWIWAYIPDRNQYLAVQKYVNTASYIVLRAYNDDIVLNLDDGSRGGAYGLELPMKYVLDAFNLYN